VRSPQVVDVGV